MDRLTVSGALSISDPSKAGFLKDVTFEQGGMLQTSFVVTFMCLAPVFGYLGDRYNRRTIICCGILFWSFFTLMCSFCTTYYQLLVCRSMVGVGEASYATIAPTIIADMYPTKTRTQALAIFYIGIPLGGALGYLGGVVGSLYGWQWAFRMTPPIGLVLALVARTFLLNPERGNSDNLTKTYHTDVRDSDPLLNTDTDGEETFTHTREHTQAQYPYVSVRERGHERNGVVGFLEDSMECVRVRSFLFSTLGFTSVTFATGALGLWGPKFIVDITSQTESPISTSEASMMLGGVTAINGIVGTLSGAIFGVWLGRYTERADPFICGIGMGVAAPFCSVALEKFQSNSGLAWLCLFIAEYGLCLNWALNASILLSVIAPERRSTAESIQILLSHIFGDALSPYVVGLVSDTLVAKGLSIECILKPTRTSLDSFRHRCVLQSTDMSEQIGGNLNDLEEFRANWQADIREKKKYNYVQEDAGVEIPSIHEIIKKEECKKIGHFANDLHLTGDQSSNDNAERDQEKYDDKKKRCALKVEGTVEEKGLQLYVDAVYSEGMGKLNEAFQCYRRAFDLCPDVDRLYWAATKDCIDGKPSVPAATASVAVLAAQKDGVDIHAVAGLGYDLHYDHDLSTEARARLASESCTHLSSRNSNGNKYAINEPDLTGIDRDTGIMKLDEKADLNCANGDEEQTLYVLLSLLNPQIIPSWAPDVKGVEGEDINQDMHVDIDVDVDVDAIVQRNCVSRGVDVGLKSLSVNVEDMGKPHISCLPHEIIAKIVGHIVLPDLDLASVERLGSTCRFMYLKTREATIWQAACKGVWGDAVHDEEANEVRDLQYWRQMYIHRPRPRFDGVYVSKDSYMRPGERDMSSFYAPCHIVEHYRYLRFSSRGTVVSATTPMDPIRFIQRMGTGGQWREDQRHGICVGEYHLNSDGSVSCSVTRKHSLANPATRTTKPSRRNRNNQPEKTNSYGDQILTMEFSLASTNRRLNNRLKWLNYTMIVETNDQPLHSAFNVCNLKNFHFVRVKKFSNQQHIV
eukprot:CFRG2859T1